MIPYHPIRVTNNIPEYSIIDIENFGKPDYYGIENYLVIDSYEKELVLDWHDEVHLITDGQYIHRYDRIQRFTATLFQFIGHSRVVIPLQLINIIKNNGFSTHPKLVWNSIRSILKKYDYTKFYNRIPCILKILKYPYNIRYKGDMLFKIQNDFKKINDNFNEKKKELGINYFPNIRYVALYLMEKNGFVFEYHIPKTRVKKIETKLYLLINKLIQV